MKPRGIRTGVVQCVSVGRLEKKRRKKATSFKAERSFSVSSFAKRPLARYPKWEKKDNKGKKKGREAEYENNRDGEEEVEEKRPTKQEKEYRRSTNGIGQ